MDFIFERHSLTILLDSNVLFLRIEKGFPVNSYNLTIQKRKNKKGEKLKLSFLINKK